jgi:hypothetical protein
MSELNTARKELLGGTDGSGKAKEVKTKSFGAPSFLFFPRLS